MKTKKEKLRELLHDAPTVFRMIVVWFERDEYGKAQQFLYDLFAEAKEKGREIERNKKYGGSDETGVSEG